jgi:hypothetical protein
MRWLLICFLVLAACSRPPKPEPPSGTIEVFDEKGRLSMSLVPTDGGFVLLDFNLRPIGTLRVGSAAAAYDMNGAALSKLDGDKIVDVDGKLMLHIKREGTKVRVLGADGHERYVIEGDELLKDGLPVIAPIKVNGVQRPLMARLLTLDEEPLDVRLTLAAAFAF